MTAALATRVRVSVPATSANLGPGFDTLGLALSYGDTLTVSRRESGLTFDLSGEGEQAVARDESNLVFRSIQFVFERVGVELPGLHIAAKNRIPHGRGLGSSAAAIVSGVMAAKGLLSPDVRLTPQQVLEFATELEGHPDNIAPALLGGLTIAWMEAGETGLRPRAKQLSVHRGVAPLLLVPAFEVSTRLARSLQPEQVPHADAVFNVSRSSLLVAALTQSPELLFEATEDRLHQGYRAAAMPDTHALVLKLRELGFAAVVSGAGPSILVLSNGPAQRLQAIDAVAELAAEWRTLPLTVNIEGATIEKV